MDFESSQTYKNLQKAFEGECKASGKYLVYGASAKDQGYEELANIFLETSSNEKEHAEIWLRVLNRGTLPDIKTDLQDAIKGESYEWRTMYQEFANVARQEGYEEIANLFDGVGMIERHHDYRYQKFLDMISNYTYFCKNEPIMWICLNCGNIYWGKCVPEKCPVCNYPQGYYTPLCDCL